MSLITNPLTHPSPTARPMGAPLLAVSLLTGFLLLTGLLLFSRQPPLIQAASSAAITTQSEPQQLPNLLTANPLSPQLMPISPTFSMSAVSFETDYTNSIAWGDMDGDGDLDILAGDWVQQNEVYANDGSGSFTLLPNALPAEMDTTWSIAWGDMDGDGDLDILAGNYGQQNKVYANDDSGTFSLLPTALPTETDFTRSIAWGDMDGDGDLDVLAGNNGQNKVYANDGSGIFSLLPTALPAEADDTYSIAWGDMDGDGDLDILAGNYQGQNKVYANDGNGSFSLLPTALPAESDGTWSIAWGDMDDDGDLDILAGNRGQNKVYANDGNGSFSLLPSALPAESDHTWSIDWGDMDGDGNLDILAGNRGQNKVYANDGNGSFTLLPNALPAEMDTTWSIAWGDMDGDGDLDILAGNYGQQNKVYANDGSGSFNLQPTALPAETGDHTWSIAWGDMDGDGDLDILAGNGGVHHQQNKVYANDGNGSFSLLPTALPAETDGTYSIAWGDMDGDGDLDILAGNGGNSGGQNKVYANDGNGNFTLLPTALPAETDDTRSIAWGDMDGDGDLDVLVGNSTNIITGKQNKVYANDGNGNFTLLPTALPAETDFTESIAWGDMDGDGDLDILAGNYGGQNKVYANDGSGSFSLLPTALPVEGDNTVSIAWGDMDGDGDLDILVGNKLQQNKVYANDGSGSFSFLPSALPAEADRTWSIDWGDMDGDGDLDILAGNGGLYNQQNKVYANDGNGNFTLLPSVLPVELDHTTSIVWGDMDGDGDLDVLVGNDGNDGNNYQQNKVYVNTRHRFIVGGSSGLVFPAIISPLTATANFYVQDGYLDQQQIPISYTLFSPNNLPVGRVAAYYSTNGGGHWLPAIATTNTLRTHLATSPWPTATISNTHVFTWDTFTSGFFGQSDNVVLRLVALPQAPANTPAGTFQYRNQAAGLIQFGSAAAATFPFRVRGTQVRVLSSTVPIPDALVYRLPAGQNIGALPMTSQDSELLLRTNSEGYLQGRGQMGLGDTLFAMVPISEEISGTYTVYATNIDPSLETIAGTQISQPGVQTINVSADNPLILFHLDVSLEWDAQEDSAYMAELEANLQRASELLFDWSNGQMALGNISIYHNRENWQAADIQILASNRYRPNADQGGLSPQITQDPTVPFTEYEPGQLRIGATWNRFGEAGGNAGEDWPRTLVHELGHYLLFMNDNYYGFNDQGDFIPVSSCTGVMADPYATVAQDGQTEFHADTDWQTYCAETASHRLAGRSDWATLTTFYPWLQAPTTEATYGPNLYPLATMQIQENIPITATNTLDNPLFTLLQEGGSGYFAGEQARIFLIREGEHLFDLGGVELGQLFARGVEPDDRLCLQDFSQQHYGCKVVTETDNHELEIDTTTDWQPHITLSPVNSVTVQITVTLNISSPLQAQLYRHNGRPEDAIDLSFVTSSEGVYQFAGTLLLDEPAPSGAVHLWLDDGGVRYDLVADYALGGNPWCIFGIGDTCSGSSPQPAPVLSTDGLASIVGEELEFDEGEFYILQAANRLPDVPTWTMVVGQAYQFSKSANAPDFDNTHIQIGYLQREVPLVTKDALFVYYHDGETWRQLPTKNLSGSGPLVSAPVAGEGIYVVMATIMTPALNEGWNIFAYPNVNPRPVDEALASLNPELYDCTDYCYTSVYAWQQSEEWFLYDQTVVAEHPVFTPMVNTLETLQPLHGYWIYATQAITPLIQPLTSTPLARYHNTVSLPPATLYGWVTTTTTGTLQVGNVIEAKINGNLCGSSTLIELEGQLAYVIQVEADNGNGCGVFGRQIVFEINGQAMPNRPFWSDRAACYQPIGETGTSGNRCFINLNSIYLPVIGN